MRSYQLDWWYDQRQASVCTQIPFPAWGERGGGKKETGKRFLQRGAFCKNSANTCVASCVAGSFSAKQINELPEFAAGRGAFECILA